ncbi:MAG: hypothetical protein E7074_02700 [Bacteroidales bacterium]|jgi:hypothetical protein|nr:hypothetical protein [Bacteroidales bacterium]MBO7546103.1 hypothetical protein [Paludibacteraceae bacterium]MBR4520843.1 hypothetical protein [Paludibacteraceae bacterium]
MEATQLNPVQLQLLQMFAPLRTEEGLRDLQTVLTDYYVQKVSKHATEIWNKMNLDQHKLEELCSIHERLPYK